MNEGRAFKSIAGQVVHTPITKKERQKLEQTELKKSKQPSTIKPEELEEVISSEVEIEPEMPEVFDYEQMREDYGW